MEADILTWNDKVVGVQMPVTVTLEIVETDPGVKGNTAQGEWVQRRRQPCVRDEPLERTGEGEGAHQALWGAESRGRR